MISNNWFWHCGEFSIKTFNRMDHRIGMAMVQNSQKMDLRGGCICIYIHTIPYRSIPCHICIALDYIALDYIVLLYAALHCIALHINITLHYITLQYITYVEIQVYLCKYNSDTVIIYVYTYMCVNQQATLKPECSST